jgi:hypothetical protein
MCTDPTEEAGGLVAHGQKSSSCSILAGNSWASDLILETFDLDRAGMKLLDNLSAFRLEEYRKVWCVNAVDYTVATYGHAENIYLMAHALDYMAWVIQTSMMTVWSRSNPSLAKYERIPKETAIRYSRISVYM